ncbi:MAG: hypothetical protein CMJ31_08115 [Phycisphaerae bacterium]|nr:hypothetical protein [Phycisphaerae bacterium]
MTSGVRSDTVQISFLGSSPVLTITNEDSGVTRGQAFVIPMNQIDGWQTFTETLGGSNATPTGETTSEQGGQIYAGSPLMGAGPQSPQGQLLSGSLAMLPPAGTAVPLPSPATLAAIGIGGLLFGSRRRISAKSINP